MGALWQPVACAKVRSNIRSVAGSKALGDAYAPGNIAVGGWRQASQACFRFDRLECLSKTVGDDFSAGLRHAIGVRRNLVRRGRLTLRTMGSGRESFVARELCVLQSAAAPGVYAGRVTHLVVRRHALKNIRRPSGADAALRLQSDFVSIGS